MNLAIIQCRMNSTRLPGKALLKLNDKPVIWHVYNRVKKSKQLDNIVIATGDEAINKELIKYSVLNNMPIISGEQDNVLKRYCDIIRLLKLDHDDNIVRITADCPLVDSEMIDSMLKVTGKKDIVGNQDWCFDGADIEIIKAGLLLHAEKKYLFDEHVTQKLKKDFRVFNCQFGNYNLSKIHLSLDTQADYERIKKIFLKLGNEFVYMDIVNMLGELI